MRPAVCDEIQIEIFSPNLPKTKVFGFWYILSTSNDPLKENQYNFIASDLLCSTLKTFLQVLQVLPSPPPPPPEMLLIN